MSTIPNMTLPSTTLVADELYRNGIFHPAEPPDSLEVLNGGVDDANLAPAMKIPGWAVAPSAFATGYFRGFDRAEFVYAKQLAGATSGTVGDTDLTRVVHAQWSARVFVPYNVSAMMWWVQGFCRQDACLWKPGGPSPTQTEFWDLRVSVNHTPEQGAYMQLPHGYSETTTPSASISQDPQNEERMRFVSRFGAVGPLVKGYHQVVVSVWANVLNPDPRTAKLSVPSGGIGLLALR